MSTIKTFDLCVIGGGSGGLSFAAFAAQMDLSVALIERDKMGGECLNAGCVPSKALLHIGHSIKKIKESQSLGITFSNLQINQEIIKNYVKEIIQKIGQRDSKGRFEKLGVNVIEGTAKFIDKKTIIVSEEKIQAKYFVIATGSTPVIPPIEGLKDVSYLTNKNLFNLEELPKHLIIIGGGGIGCEMAQAFSLLGSRVSIVQRSRLMQKDEPEFAQIVKESLRENGTEIYENSSLQSVKQEGSAVYLTFIQNEKPITLTGSHLLIATGRRPALAELNLEAAGIEHTAKGISVNRKLRTSNKRVYAVGDVTGHYQFTHIANYHANIAIKNILFKLPAKTDYTALPWVTYTEPELAHVGLTEKDALTGQTGVKIISTAFKENDRAVIEQEEKGLIKIITAKNGKILGASIVSKNAGELIAPWCLAISKKLKLKDIANLIIAYPTESEIHKQIAGKFYLPMITKSWIKKLVKILF